MKAIDIRKTTRYTNFVINKRYVEDKERQE